MKKLRVFVLAYWRLLLFAVFFIASSALVLFNQLDSLAPSLSPGEKSTLLASATLHRIIQDPLGLPLKLLQWLFGYTLPGHALLFARLPSTLLGLASVALFVYILRDWYGPRTTILGFTVFVTSAWFLHIGRFAGTDIEYLLATLALLALYTYLHAAADQPHTAYLWIVVNTLLFFIPGLVWFVLVTALWQREELTTMWQTLCLVWQRLVWAAIAIIGLGALAYSLFHNPQLLMTWLGVPEHMLPWQTIVKNLANTALALVYHGPHLPEQWLGQLPLLNAFMSIMLVAGTVFYAQHWQAGRSRLLAVYLLLSAGLISLGGGAGLSLIVPIIYLVAIGGIAYMLRIWLAVFPRNPLARTTGIVIVAGVIVLSCIYNLDQYFVAWPHNPETIAIYRPS